MRVDRGVNKLYFKDLAPSLATASPNFQHLPVNIFYPVIILPARFHLWQTPPLR
jgi:hypothetical protein